MDLVANLMENTPVKESWKSANNCQSCYERCKSTLCLTCCVLLLFLIL